MAPGKLPGCSGSRNLHNNISDLRAQVAANQKVCLHSVALLLPSALAQGYYSELYSRDMRTYVSVTLKNVN